jgi:hypothetical protein
MVLKRFLKWAVMAVCTVLGAAQSQPPSVVDRKTTEAVYKNIQILKGLPAYQLIPTMNFISASLGVGCDHCHVTGAFEKDEKRPKLVARDMIKMTAALNKTSFEGKSGITCNSCHRGEREPQAIPAISDRPTALEKPLIPPRITAQEILDQYVIAVGGADALQKTSSRVQKGTTSLFGGREYPLEVFERAPNQRAAVLHLPLGDSATIFDGKAGWTTVPGHPFRELEGGDLDFANLDADLQLPLTMKQKSSELMVSGCETIANHDTYVVTWKRDGLPPIYFYFDRQTALLVRQLRYTETALGLLPTQVDYADYREASGTKIPFEWTVARPGSHFVTHISQVVVNVPIDDTKFNKPAEPPPINQ